MLSSGRRHECSCGTLGGRGSSQRADVVKHGRAGVRQCVGDDVVGGDFSVEQCARAATSAEGAAHDLEAVEMSTAALRRLITRRIHALQGWVLGREGSMCPRKPPLLAPCRARTDWIRSGKGCSQIVDVALGR
jgi:hypothetical protein